MKKEKDFKNIVITYHMSETGVSEKVAGERWNGLIQFLGLCIETKKEQVASQPIDELWHDALKFTEGYDAFCIARFRTKIHHKPATIPGQPSGYLRTRELAVKKFRKLSGRAWPLAERSEWSIGYVLEK